MANIEFVWWWLFVLVPLPLIVYRFLPPVKERAAIQLPYLPQQNQAIAPRQWLAKTLVIALWLCLVTAAARPVWYGEPVTTSPKHRDMMLVVDLSYSMSQQDMKSGDQFIDRLSAVKQVLSDFIAKRQGDRLGLIFFADHAYLQTPLTLDRQTIAQQLNQAVLRLIGTKTAIGEGIGLATKTFIDSDAPQRVMILLSDGSNTSGVLDPMEAAKIAKKYHTTIYTVGIGAGEMMVKEFFMTRKVNTAEDLDEKTLQAIANETGGQYFRARNQQDLQHIYDTINQLEPISKASQTWRPQSEWFGYPLALALLLSVILMIMRRNYV
ncbi:VWA domain-containing protein [Vibrio fluvialis]|uniref:vWA domain-containing protein n=1 Tax=Vibrio sp. bablab_jr001 TaxID=2755067 RepID=UPI0018F1DCB0|nr:VWA domain-containing protein [Vibrio sp. bablab_jr001]EKO3398518.1 VWA domain-containing protein [Vibrio fluvialis]EKO3471820.1 VWA domain-containing protein [Vibrio fluvialis]MBY8115335.1 VWA domain-containing protein [Vibrio fluvialis]MBY8248427.1 VWA domain-containing protein [Vibrio fluvialis]MBY8282096.1 VWA domain-containing protein [Vibrio fluvialis]